MFHSLPILHNWPIKRNADGVHVLYVNFFLRQLAINTFGIFVPLFLLDLAKNLLGGGTREGLILIAVYYFAIRVLYVLFTLPVANFIHLFGTRWSIFISNIFLILYLLSLSLVQNDLLFLGASALIAGLYLPFYFLSYHYLLTADSKAKNIGSEVATIHVLDRVGMIVGPLLGGLITINFGFPALFISSITLVIASGIPPFFMKHHNHTHQFTFKDIGQVLMDKKNRNILLSVSADAIKVITDLTLVPVYIYLLLSDYEKIGLFYSITGLVTIGIYWSIGWLYDKHGQKKLLKAGTVLNSLVWWGRAFSFTPTMFFVVEIIKRLSNPVLLVTHDALVYHWGHKDPLNLMLARALVWSAVAGAWFLLMALLFYFSEDETGVSLNIVFALVGGIIWGYLYAIKK